jgi:bifunctional non-homologous end joining protein LigD
MGLVSYVKTSGKKGLHVYVPLNRKETTFEDTKIFSKAVAGIMQKHYPYLVTTRMAKKERSTKVFINWSQNGASKTMISVYSLRARERPIVSFPVDWKDLENDGLGDPERLQITHSEALSRVEKKGDLFREVLVKEQRLPHL